MPKLFSWPGAMKVNLAQRKLCFLSISCFFYKFSMVAIIIDHNTIIILQTAYQGTQNRLLPLILQTIYWWLNSITEMNELTTCHSANVSRDLAADALQTIVPGYVLNHRSNCPSTFVLVKPASQAFLYEQNKCSIFSSINTSL